MIDLYHYVGGDLALSPTGDLATIDGTVKGQQRILRRLLTNPPELDAAGNVIAAGDYLFHQEYGAGVPKLVGQNVNIAQIKALIRGQMMLESCVASTPAPVIDVITIPEGVSVTIQYTDADNKTAQILSFDVNR